MRPFLLYIILCVLCQNAWGQRVQNTKIKESNGFEWIIVEEFDGKDFMRGAKTVNGEQLIPCEYSWIYYRDHYFHAVKEDDELSVKALYAEDGKCIIPLTEKATDITVMQQDGIEPYVLLQKDKKYGVYSLSGQEIIEAKYDNIFAHDKKYYTKNKKGEIAVIHNNTNDSSSDDSDYNGIDFLIDLASLLDFSTPKSEAEKNEDNGDLYRMADNVLAVDYYRTAANLGRASAQTKLGYCYHEGFGVKKNVSEAIKWYRKAAEKGDLDALFNLGWCYFEGDGISKNVQEAIKLWRRAANQGHDYSQYHLGVCYENGYGVKQNDKLAIDWYSKAAQQDLEEAKEALELLKKRN